MFRGLVLCIVGASFFGSVPAFSQNSVLWQKMKAQFPDEPAVYLDISTITTLGVKNDSLICFSEQSENVLFLKENVEMLAGKRLYASFFQSISGIAAKTEVWNGSRYKDLVVTDIKKKRDDDNSVFYDDSYYYSFSFPSAAIGNQTSLKYREDLSDPRFLPGFQFVHHLPVAKTSFTLKTTRGIELVYELRNDTKNSVHFRKYEKGDFVFYEWSAESVPAYKLEEGSPEASYYIPQLIYYVKSYPTKKGPLSVLSDLNDLYKWYGTFVVKLDDDTSPALEATVKSLIAPGDKEIDIVRKVFYWVQDNVRYIAFEDGMRGLIPHTGSYVYDKRYGDCKDMANLIVSMLRVAGIKSYRTWIGTRDLPYRYSTLPTPLVDNHMIATFIGADHQYYFLDATGNYTALGLPSAMIQGKEALIGFDAKKFEVKAVPERSKEDNKQVDSSTLHIDKGNLTGNGRISFTGYAKINSSYQFDKARQESVKDNVVRLVAKGSNKFYLDNFTISHLRDRDVPIAVDYNFRISDYVHEVGNEIYVNLNLQKERYNEYILPSRQSPRENEYRYTQEEVETLVIPAGYGVEYLPPDARHDGHEIGFDISYKVFPDKVVMKKSMYVDYLMLNPEQFSSWNKSTKLLSEAYKESVILKKK